MTTVQAQRIIDALKSVGLTHGSWRKGGDFTVATERKHKRDRATGFRYIEFGDAMARIQRTGKATVEAHADELVREHGLSVTLVYGADGALVTTIVSSKYNATRVVTILRDGEWSTRSTREETTNA